MVEWMEDDLVEQPDEELLQRLFERYVREGDALVGQLSDEEVVALLRAMRVFYRRDLVRAARAMMAMDDVNRRN